MEAVKLPSFCIVVEAVKLPPACSHRKLRNLNRFHYGVHYRFDYGFECARTCFPTGDCLNTVAAVDFRSRASAGRLAGIDFRDEIMSGNFVICTATVTTVCWMVRVSIGRLVERAKTLGMNALALTDHGNLHGALEFYQKAKAAGINPIVGYEAYVAPGSRFIRDAASSKDAAYHLTLLAQNRIGFQNLIKLASKASLEGFYFKPRIDNDLLAEYNEGIICLSGCVSSEFSRAILAGYDTSAAEHDAIKTAQKFHKIFGDRYFIEIMNNNLPIQRQQLEGAVDIANRLGIPLSREPAMRTTSNNLMLKLKTCCCASTRASFARNVQRMKMEGDQFFLRSPQQMYESFPGLEAAVARIKKSPTR